MKILVSGGTGYIGGWLLRSLSAAGNAVSHVFPAGEQPPNAGDLGGATAYPYHGHGEELLEIVKSAAPDAVIHLAALTTQPPGFTGIVQMLDANVQFGVLLCEAMRLGGCRNLVNIGSYWQFDPDGEYCPNSLYAASKRAFQDIVSFYTQCHGFRALTLILFDVFGPGDHRPKFIRDLIDSARNGKEVEATSGEQSMCPVYIKDVCSALEVAARQVCNDGFYGHRVYAADSRVRISVRAMAEEFSVATRRPLNLKWGARKQRPGQITNPVNNLPLLPGWAPASGLRDALADLAAEEGLL
jgi:nucleoside-diphosphate-sugar epimerase